jgi:hypothetical protein
VLFATETVFAAAATVASLVFNLDTISTPPTVREFVATKFEAETFLDTLILLEKNASPTTANVDPIFALELTPNGPATFATEPIERLPAMEAFCETIRFADIVTRETDKLPDIAVLLATSNVDPIFTVPEILALEPIETLPVIEAF